MSSSLRLIVKKILPAPLADKVVHFGVLCKRSIRDKKRFLYSSGKPFAKHIVMEGVSFDIIIDPLKNGGVDENIAQFGYWEKDLSSQFVKHLNKGDIFLDIGANIGYHSLFVASYLKGSGKVYSFEPLHYLCNQLRESINLNHFSNIEVCNFGLAKQDGEHVLHVRDENTGGSSLLEVSGMEAFTVKEKQTVILKKLDTFLSSGVNVKMIKIDIEGYEYEALQGAVGILERNHPIIFMEFSPVFYSKESKSKPYELVTFLKSFGYSFFLLNGDTFDIENWLEQDNSMNSQIDIICKVV